MSKPIQQAVQLVTDCQQQLKKLLSGPEHNRNLLEINSHFERIKSRLIFMGGKLEPNETNAPKQFPPITNYMGKPIKKETEVTSADLNPTEDDKRKHFARVEKLYKEIGNISPTIILNSYTIATDQAVLRHVARKAGIKDWKEAELTTEFIETIQFAVEEKKELDAKQAEIEEATKNKVVEKTLTAEDMKDPEWKKMDAKPGDKVLIHPDGKKELAPKEPAASK